MMKTINNLISLKSIAVIIVVLVTQSVCRASPVQVNKRTIKYDENRNTACTVVPAPYERALKNPMKGFSPNDLKSHPWGTLSTFKFPWTRLENRESDRIEKIIDASDDMWGDAAEKNMKVIPHIYLHWNGDEKFWPADMQEDHYTSEQFKQRVVRLIERLGICWDNDPRIAFIEMGIFGKWGEQHSPAPTQELQKIVGDAFTKAFKNKKVSVRHNWRYFTDHPFGEYWASWAHYDQMYTHGNNINKVNKEDDRYKENYLGGEVAYNWGNYIIQPGESPTESVADPHHRNFVISSIRWLHCTHLRWITHGIFGGFSFTNSSLDITPPQWYYVDIVTFSLSAEITVMTTEDATVYLFPEGTSPDTASIREAAVSMVEVTAYALANLATSELDTGDFATYAIDSSNNISEASRTIRLQYGQMVFQWKELNPKKFSIQIWDSEGSLMFWHPKLNQVNCHLVLNKKDFNEFNKNYFNCFANMD